MSQDGEEAKSNSPARVTRMPFTDHHGERGWYTGAVDGATGVPNGYGTMNFSNGAVFEGQWRNGISVTPSMTREEPCMSNISPVKATRHQGIRRPPPRSPLETHYEDDRRHRSTSRSRSNSRPRMAQPPPPPVMPQLSRKVVCGMHWTDPEGNSGSYTGEVNGLNIPDGMGSMRYLDGVVVEGMWNDGEIEGAEEDDRSAVSYRQGGGALDEFMGKNFRVIGHGGSASVM